MEPHQKQHRPQANPRSQQDLPGLFQQDTTLINPEAQKMDFAESDSAEREVSNTMFL